MSNPDTQRTAPDRFPNINKPSPTQPTHPGTGVPRVPGLPNRPDQRPGIPAGTPGRGTGHGNG